MKNNTISRSEKLWRRILTISATLVIIPELLWGPMSNIVYMFWTDGGDPYRLNLIVQKIDGPGASFLSPAWRFSLFFQIVLMLIAVISLIVLRNNLKHKSIIYVSIGIVIILLPILGFHLLADYAFQDLSGMRMGF